MKRTYVEWNPHGKTRRLIELAEAICVDYADQGYDLTLRQLYYQLVARDIIPNQQKAYKSLGETINNARLGGMIDWDHIVDRTRNLRGHSYWNDPESIISSAAYSFRKNPWIHQDHHLEVWVEKEALAGVISRAAGEWDVNWFSCRGYVSQSEMWGAARRLGLEASRGKRVTILHLGDHDPSGIDMTRDIRDRLELFTLTDFGMAAADRLTVKRIALNMDQIEAFNPPPNPAKTTDSRYGAYIDAYGDESWELDALDPATLHALITDHISELSDADEMDRVRNEQEAERAQLTRASEIWGTVVANCLQEDED